MKKVGFFQSIHVKFVLIYVLLIINCDANYWCIFRQRIRRKPCKTNFKDSLTQRINLLAI